MLGWVRS